MRHSLSLPSFDWKRFNIFFALIVFQIVIKVGAVEYRTFDLRDDGSGRMTMMAKRSGVNGNTMARTESSKFSPRTGSFDDRGRYWSRSRQNRDPEHSEDDYTSSSNSYYTVNQNGEIINDEDSCENRPCIEFDRLDREHTFTIRMPKMEGRNNVVKKFVVQPMIQYVVQYDKRKEYGHDNIASSTNYEEYEGQGQTRMRRKHEQNIDRFFNDIDARFEGYWGNDENGRGSSGSGGYDNGPGGYDGGNGGGYQQGGNSNDGGGGINYEYGFGTSGGGNQGGGGADHGGYNSGNNGNSQQHLDGFVSAGVYGVPEKDNNNNGGGGSSSTASANSEIGMMNGAVNTNAMHMSTPQNQNDNAMQMFTGQGGDPNNVPNNTPNGGNSMMMSTGMGGGSLSTATATAMMNGYNAPSPNMGGMQGGNNMHSMGVPSGSMNQASSLSNQGMGAMPFPSNQQVPNQPQYGPPPGPLYGIPGMSPGQPLGTMDYVQQQNQVTQGMASFSNTGGSSMMGSGGMSGGNQMSVAQAVAGGMGMQSNGMAGGGASMGNQMGTASVMMMPGAAMSGGAASSGMMQHSAAASSSSNGGSTSISGAMSGGSMSGAMSGGSMSGAMSGAGMSGAVNGGDMSQTMGMGSSSGTSSSASAFASAGASSGGGSGEIKQTYGPPKEEKGSGDGTIKNKNKPSPSYGPPSASDSESVDSSENNSKERPSRPSHGRGKKPGGGGGKKGRGRGRKSLFRSLSAGLPKIPQSIGGHLSFMFSTGFGKNRKGRGGNGSGGSGGGGKPGNEGKSKPIDKEQVSDHILNILGLTVHHLPGNSTNQSSELNSTNPIVLWEKQVNSTYLNQLASLLPGDMLDDIAAHLPFGEEDPFDPLQSSSTITTIEESTTYQPPTSTEGENLPTTTEPILTETTLQVDADDVIRSSTISPTTVVKNVTLAQAITISSSLPPEMNDSSSLSLLEKFLLLSTTTTPSSPQPVPVFTTSPRPLIPPFPPQETRSRFRFRKPKQFQITPQSELFPPSRTQSQSFSSKEAPNVPRLSPVQTMSIVPAPTVPFDPVQAYINENLSNNLLSVEDPDIVSSVSIPASKLLHRPKIEAYYAEAEQMENIYNPIKIQFDPWLYDALQAAFQPNEEPYFIGSHDFAKRRKRKRNPRFNFVPSLRDVQNRNQIAKGKISLLNLSDQKAKL